LRSRNRFWYLCKVLVGSGTPYLVPTPKLEPLRPDNWATVIASVLADAATTTL
jgi:hypothetical protein